MPIRLTRLERQLENDLHLLCVVAAGEVRLPAQAYVEAVGLAPAEAGAGAQVLVHRGLLQELRVDHRAVDEHVLPDGLRELQADLPDLLADARVELVVSPAQRHPLVETDLRADR